MELACKESDEVLRLIEKAEEAHLCRNGEFFKDKPPPKSAEENGVHERSEFLFTLITFSPVSLYVVQVYTIAS